MTKVLSLRKAIRMLKKHYGPPAVLPTTDPFELILWENVAYLASDARREEAFLALKKKIGATPGAILAAGPGRLREVVGRAGILPDQGVAKLLRAAALARDEGGGDLEGVLGLPEKQAERVLRRFPGIGEPGVEKILLFCGAKAVLALESNGLRVLVRLGYGEEKKSYSATYRAAQAAAEGELRADIRSRQRAHLLLRRHGQELCRRSAPHCSECPVAGSCAYFSSRPKRTSSRQPSR